MFNLLAKSRPGIGTAQVYCNLERNFLVPQTPSNIRKVIEHFCSFVLEAQYLILDYVARARG